MPGRRSAMPDRKRGVPVLKTSYNQILLGQGLLIICCIFYLIWWSLSYRPGVVVDRVQGIRGLLLAITALSGIVGMILSVHGAGSIPKQGPAVSGSTLLAVGIVLYFVLLVLTRNFMGRAVTTELALIVGWLILEVTVLQALWCGGRIGNAGFYLMLAIIAAAFVISMVLYVLYYRMPEGQAFYAAMVPLITEAVSMALLLLVMLLSKK
jgi:hypothetical protein